MVKYILTALLLVNLIGTAGADVISPEGEMKKFLGPRIFRSYDMTACEEQGSIVIRIKTNYPGPHSDIDYNRADLFVRHNGKIVLAVKAGKGNQGLVLYKPDSITSEIFEHLGIPFGRYRDGNFIPVQATGGAPVGWAVMSWDDKGDGEYLVAIRISREIFRSAGISGLLQFEWATAFCANSIVETEYTLLIPGRGWGGGGPGYIPPTDRPASSTPFYMSGSHGGFSGGGGGGGNSPPEYPPYPPPNPPPPYPPPPPPPPPPIPLPASVVLFAPSLIALLGAEVWRRKKAK